jgi:predicted nucleotidyltransferase
MITTEEIKQIIISWAQSLPYKVRIHLYGSYWKGNKNPPSDIDIAFEFFDDQLLDDPLLLWIDNHEKWQQYLSEKFGMKADLQLCYENSNISKYVAEASLLLYDASETEDKF